MIKTMTDNVQDLNQMFRELEKSGKLSFVILAFDKGQNITPTLENVKSHLELLEKVVTMLLREIGVPAHIRGYHYLKDAIIFAIKDPEILRRITKSLYPEIAAKNKTTPNRVERAIRHAIEVAWSRGELDSINSIFGYTVNAGKGRPTNSEFISLIVDEIKVRGNYKDENN